MLPQLTGFFRLFQARLSRRVVLGVFTSLIVIEGLIFIPSVHKREQEFLQQLEEASLSKVEWILRTYPHKTADEEFTVDEELLDAIQKLHKVTMLSSIVGGTLYNSNGEIIDTFGDIPGLTWEEIQSSQIPADKRVSRLHRTKARYEIAWIDTLPQGNILVLNYEITQLQAELFAYVLRIGGLVILISVVVTSCTMIVLGKMVIVPILHLQQDLIAAGEALSENKPHPNFYSLSGKERQDELGEVMVAFHQMFRRVHQEIQERQAAENCLRQEKAKSERLLLNILPAPIAQKLKEGENNIAERFAEVTILFADIVGFTQLSQRVAPAELVELLNEIFSAFDSLTERYGLEKIKTIGDNYMVAGGLPQYREDHAIAIAQMALEMQQTIAHLNLQNCDSLSIRIGINTGPVIAGVIGTKKFIYDLWGDAVNTASRMESHGVAGKIQVTESTYEHLCDRYDLEPRGMITVKGKGEMKTYFLRGKKASINIEFGVCPAGRLTSTE